MDINEKDLVCDCTEIHTHEVETARAHIPADEEIFDIAEFFKVFSDSSRVKILWVLHDCELCVCDIAECLNMTVSAVSHQLKILRQSNLVHNRRDGKTVYYSLADDHVKKIFEMAVEHLTEE